MAQLLELKADANGQIGSQVKCAAIDSINREEVQHGVCSRESRCKQSIGDVQDERTSEIQCVFLRRYRPFQR